MTYRDKGIPAQCEAATVLFIRISEIIDRIPEDYPRRDQIVHSLKGRQDSIHYTHPDAMGMRWGEVSRILQDTLPDPKQVDWAKSIADLYGKTF